MTDYNYQTTNLNGIIEDSGRRWFLRLSELDNKDIGTRVISCIKGKVVNRYGKEYLLSAIDTNSTWLVVGAVEEIEEKMFWESEIKDCGDFQNN